MDEIHINPYLDYKGGNVVGASVNDNESLATSAYTFMITSICSDFKEVVHIAPLSKINHVLLFNFVKTIITRLEAIGYKVFCVLSDNNAINGKAMSNFSPKNELNIVFPHPVDANRPLFFLFDSVHILKCIFNAWLNSKPDQTFTFPDFCTGEKKVACFASLKKMHDVEYNMLLKFGFSLNLKALYPSSMERQNVKLALKIFNPFVIEGLQHFNKDIPNAQGTADFLKIILKWWHIINVKTPLKGKRLRDIFQEPIVKSKIVNNQQIDFLKQMLIWLDNWKSDNFKNKLTPQTHKALTHTIYGVLEIVTYCFKELNLNYILLGKLQTDPLENRFGRYRQLAGGQYHISIRQLYESEKRLRIQSILTLKSQKFGELKIKKFYESPECDEPDSDENYSKEIDEILKKHSIQKCDMDNLKPELPVLTYLGGYCSHIVLKKLKCNYCKNSMIICNTELIVEDNFNLITNLSRGALQYPRDHVVEIVIISYILFQKILSDYENKFLNIYSQKTFLTQLVFKYILEQEFLIYFDGCNTHTAKRIIDILLSSIANTLIKNYCFKKNNRLGKGRKRKLDTYAK